MFSTSMVLSGLLVLVTAVLAWRAKTLRPACLVCWMAVAPIVCILPLAFVSSLFFYHAAALGAFTLICAVAQARRRTFVLGSLVVFAGIYIGVGYPRWQTIRRAMDIYPVVSLEDRLEYERQAYRAAGRELPAMPDAARVRYSVYGYPNAREVYSRQSALHLLHDRTSVLFENTSAFGVGRMPRGDVNSIFLADPIRTSPPISMPEPTPVGFAAPMSAEDSMLASTLELPFVVNLGLKNLDDASRAEFLNPLGFGYVKNRGQVSGFVSHRFTKFPDLTLGGPTGSWRIESLDLISMLKHQEPVAYVSRNLPRMDELRDAPTRPLDEFESEHLAKLRAGEGLSAAMGPRRIRMIGAIRAQEHCLSCHTAKENDLLGAFSYDLRLDVVANIPSPNPPRSGEGSKTGLRLVR